MTVAERLAAYEVSILTPDPVLITWCRVHWSSSSSLDTRCHYRLSDPQDELACHLIEARVVLPC